jgi:hypothetical protein
MKSFFEKSGNINHYNFIVFFKYNFNFVKENREEKIKEIEKLANDCDLTFKKYHIYISPHKKLRTLTNSKETYIDVTSDNVRYSFTFINNLF